MRYRDGTEIDDRDLIQAGMCMMEEFLRWDDMIDTGNTGVLAHMIRAADFRQNYGIEVRAQLATLAPHCEWAWMQAKMVVEYDEPYDFDWVPYFMQRHIEWSARSGASMKRSWRNALVEDLNKWNKW